MGGAKLAEEIAMIDVATLAIASEVKGARRRFALENDDQALEIPHGRVFPVRVCGVLRRGSFPLAILSHAPRRGHPHHYPEAYPPTQPAESGPTRVRNRGGWGGGSEG